MTAFASHSLTIPQFPCAAAQLARQWWSANCAALGRRQPAVADLAREFPAEREWVFARDNSLTCLNADGSWWAGCSVPRAAATKLLNSLDPSPMVSAYLAPAYAALLKAARVRVGTDPALIAIVPEVDTLRIILAGGDFAAEIVSHRLWFVVGEDWADGLRKLFQDYPGLPPAGRFIRTKLTDRPVIEPMIVAAQAVLGDIAAARTAALQRLQQSNVRASKKVDRLLVIAPSRFHLWDDATPALDEMAVRFEKTFGGTAQRFDSDDPLNASPLALAALAAGSDAVLAANVYRADAAGAVAPAMPWLTWVTREPVSPFDPAAPRDRLVVVTSALALAAARAGWPAAAIVAAQPIDRPSRVPSSTAPHLAIVADLPVVAIPKSVEDLSSHRLLWEFVDAEVDADPFTIGDDPVGYLLGRAGEIGITAAELDICAFVDGLIVPRWQRAVARQMMAAQIPLRIYGRGWSEEPVVARAFVGELTDRSTFERVCAAATALFHAWPGMADHPINYMGTPVVSVPASWAELCDAVNRALTAHGVSAAKGIGLSIIPLRRVLDSLA